MYHKYSHDSTDHWVWNSPRVKRTHIKFEVMKHSYPVHSPRWVFDFRLVYDAKQR
jgi:GT2 family glycosyltransferase